MHPPPQIYRDLRPHNLTTRFIAEIFSNKTCGEFSPHVLLLKFSAKYRVFPLFFSKESFEKYWVRDLVLGGECSPQMPLFFSNKTCGENSPHVLLLKFSAIKRVVQFWGIVFFFFLGGECIGQKKKRLLFFESLRLAQ